MDIEVEQGAQNTNKIMFQSFYCIKASINDKFNKFFHALFSFNESIGLTYDDLHKDLVHK